MRITLYAPIIIACISTLPGCSGRIVHLQDDRGNEVTCEVSTGSAMMTGVLARDAAIDNCVKDRKEAGFKVISEE